MIQVRQLGVSVLSLDGAGGRHTMSRLRLGPYNLSESESRREP